MPRIRIVYIYSIDAYFDGQSNLVLTIPDIDSGWECDDIEDYINETRGVIYDAILFIVIPVSRSITIICFTINHGCN